MSESTLENFRENLLGHFCNRRPRGLWRQPYPQLVIFINVYVIIIIGIIEFNIVRIIKFYDFERHCCDYSRPNHL